MYGVSSAFNNCVKSIMRTMDCRVLINNEDKTLSSISIVIDRKNQNTEHIIGNAIPQKLTLTLINYPSEYNFIGNSINISFGCLIEDNYEYVPMPTFYVESAKYNQENRQWDITAYDKLYFLNNYSIDEIIIDYPCTRLEYLQKVCELGDIVLATTDFIGYNIALTSAPNFNSSDSVLSVISTIAEAGLSNAYIGRNNKLYFKAITNPKYVFNSPLDAGNYYFSIGDLNVGFTLSNATQTLTYTPINNLINNSITAEYLDDTINYTQLIGFVYENNITSDYDLTYYADGTKRSNYTSASIKSHYGKVNTVALSRGDVEDNVYLEDDSSIETNGKTEFSITNNPFIDYGETDKRYDFIKNIFAIMNNFECNAYTLDFRGNPALDCYDYITFLDCDNQDETHTELFVGDKITYATKAFKAQTELTALSQREIDKTKALSVKDALSNTQIIVDKVNKQINAIISSIDEINNNVVTLSNIVKSTNQQTDITISMTGGNNLLRNSAFYKDTEYWVLSDGASYEIVQDTEATNNTECGSILFFKNGSISQEFNTTIGEVYTFSCLLKNNATVPSGISYIRLYRDDVNYIEIYNNEQHDHLENITYTYTASVNNPKLVFYTNNNNSDFSISDIRVVKGNVSQSWSQHSEEVYGKGILIDNSGVEVRSLAGESTKSKLDNDSLLIRNNNSIITEVSDERVLSNELISKTLIKIGSVVLEEVEQGRIFVYKGDY